MTSNRLEYLNNSHFDILIIGGGIAGAGILRDATYRGLKCLLIEHNDFASGTSSNSGKLVHGGLRYLEYFNFKLVRESCRERYNLLKIVAPHLVRPMRFIVPFYQSSRIKRWKMCIGLLIYNFFSLFKRVGPIKLMNKNTTPYISKNNLLNSISYYDCTVLDSRLVIDTIKSATEDGACAENYISLEAIYENEKNHHCKLQDTINNTSTINISATSIINATGSWSNQTLDILKQNNKFNLTYTSGIHITLHRDKLPIDSTISAESTVDQRFIYIVPWENWILVGTTDQKITNINNTPIENNDINYLLESLNHYFPHSGITHSDIISVNIGTRPLITDNKINNEVKMPRDHKVIQSKNKITSVTGGKLTTYRLMASKIVDIHLKSFFDQKYDRAKSTLSPISGGDKTSPPSLESNNISNDIINLFVSRYGSNSTKIIKMIGDNPSDISYISPEVNYTIAEIKYFIMFENAKTTEDIIKRRTTISYQIKDTQLISQNIQNIMKAFQ